MSSAGRVQPLVSLKYTLTERISSEGLESWKTRAGLYIPGKSGGRRWCCVKPERFSAEGWVFGKGYRGRGLMRGGRWVICLSGVDELN